MTTNKDQDDDDDDEVCRSSHRLSSVSGSVTVPPSAKALSVPLSGTTRRTRDFLDLDDVASLPSSDDLRQYSLNLHNDENTANFDYHALFSGDDHRRNRNATTTTNHIAAQTTPQENIA